jgi:hypothetical protein
MLVMVGGWSLDTAGSSGYHWHPFPKHTRIGFDT